MIALAGVIVLLVFGGLAGFAGLSPNGDGASSAGLLGIIGLAVAAFVFLIAAPSIIAGAGLLKYAPWSRTLTIVLSAFHLISIPIGTALGVYGLWVLLNPESEAMFRGFTAASPPALPPIK